MIVLLRCCFCLCGAFRQTVGVTKKMYPVSLKVWDRYLNDINLQHILSNLFKLCGVFSLKYCSACTRLSRVTSRGL